MRDMDNKELKAVADAMAKRSEDCPYNMGASLRADLWRWSKQIYDYLKVPTAERVGARTCECCAHLITIRDEDGDIDYECGVIEGMTDTDMDMAGKGECPRWADKEGTA